MRREFLMLAQKYDPNRHVIGGWYLSEKLDGMRCFWDGGISRGISKREIPWANTAKDKKDFTCTGLWSRYGNPIFAPDNWIDQLPRIPLDGELYINHQSRQELMSIVKTHVPGFGWGQVKFHVFDIPPLPIVFQDGTINNPNFKATFHNIEGTFLKERYKNLWLVGKDWTFEEMLQVLKNQLPHNGPVIQMKQLLLPSNCSDAHERAMDEMIGIVKQGGEGICLRHRASVWEPQRSDLLLKFKHEDDAEGIVTGYISGKGKLEGLMGALILDFQGKRLELSGFTDAERALSDSEWAQKNPGVEVPDEVTSMYFPRGTQVTFTYRELSRDGIPIEARYLRKRED